MSKSKDLVRFRIPMNRLYNHEAGGRKLRQLVTQVFGVIIPPSAGEDPVIICRPSQFARFLILRHQNGIENWFAELNAELFTRESEPKRLIFDVTSEPNTVKAEPLRIGY